MSKNSLFSWKSVPFSSSKCSHRRLFKNLNIKVCKNINFHVGFEILTAMVMQSTIFRDIMSCSPLKVNRRYEGTYRPNLHGRRINRAGYLLVTCFHASVSFALFLDPEDVSNIFLRNFGWLSTNYTALFSYYRR
jgi:hypothetical protein